MDFEDEKVSKVKKDGTPAFSKNRRLEVLLNLI